MNQMWGNKEQGVIFINAQIYLVSLT